MASITLETKKVNELEFIKKTLIVGNKNVYERRLSVHMEYDLNKLLSLSIYE